MRKNAVIYRGPSLLTGDPILVAITGFASRSHNAKTGAMLQAWILRADMPPTDAVASGADLAICGKCQLRSGSTIGRSCRCALCQGEAKRAKSVAILPHGQRTKWLTTPAVALPRPQPAS